MRRHGTILARVGGLLASSALLCACNLLLEPVLAELGTDGDADTDTDADVDRDVETDADRDADADSDVDPDVHADADVDPDAEADADPERDADAELDADPDVDGRCGNGSVEIGEECDEVSSFCDPSSCVRVTPLGWLRCGGARPTTFVGALPADVARTWRQAFDDCLAILPGLGATSYATAGLAVMPDLDAWSCVQGAVSFGAEYWIGLRQRVAGAEPLGGWVWVASDGRAEVELGPFDLAGPIPYDLNNEGAGWIIAEADCARYTNDWRGWSAYDCICDEAAYYAPLCMVVF